MYDNAYTYKLNHRFEWNDVIFGVKRRILNKGGEKKKNGWIDVCQQIQWNIILTIGVLISSISPISMCRIEDK